MLDDVLINQATAILNTQHACKAAWGMGQHMNDLLAYSHQMFKKDRP